MRGTSLRACLLAILLGVVLAGCGQDVAVPNVVGLRLDKAHQALEELEFEDFDDQDFFGDRAVMLDANWVVLEQDPSGESVGTGTTITLQVGKIGEANTTERLPEGSPVLAQIRKDEAEDAAEKARDKAEKAAKAKEQQAADAAQAARNKAKRGEQILTYVNSIDPIIRLAQGDLRQIKVVGQEVRSGRTSGDALRREVADAKVGLSQYRDQFAARAPDKDGGRTTAHEQLLASLDIFERAALTLLSAEGPDRAATLTRFDQVYAEARTAWNNAVTAAYDTTTVPAPLLQ